MADLRYAYLHGFGSGPASYKGTTLRERLAGEADLELLDLNRPSFEELSPRAALAHLDEVTEGARWRLIGSSYGGWITSHFAAAHERVEKVILLCPGFDLARRWPSLLGERMMAEWEASGRLPVEMNGEKRFVHWGFQEEALELDPRPAFTQPAWIVHGTRDETVPIESSRTYADEHANVTLHEVDDDHGLAASVDLIEALFREHLLESHS